MCCSANTENSPAAVAEPSTRRSLILILCDGAADLFVRVESFLNALKHTKETHAIMGTSAFS